jgi:hypothetical protein
MALRSLRVCLVMWWSLNAWAQAPIFKMIDCAKEKTNLRCKRLDLKQAGSIGEGPAFAQGMGDEVTGGFLRGNKLIVSSAPMGHGAIVEVDLKTGNRTLLAGSVDTTEMKGENVKYKDNFGRDQEAYTLKGLANVRPLPNGNFAVSSPGTRRLEILEVDAKTGNLKLLWASNVSEDAGQKTFENLPPSMFCETAGERDEHPNLGGATFEVDKDGSLYLWARENPVATGAGLYRVKDGVCQAVSTYSSSGKSKVGAGYALAGVTSMDANASLWMSDTKLLSLFGSFTLGQALTTWDVSTGQRAAISFKARTIAKTKGKGEDDVGNSGLAVNALGAFTTHVGAFELMKIDLGSGDRTRVIINSGPLAEMGGRLEDNYQRLWAVPNSQLLILSFQNSLILIDPKAGTSNVLSY